MIKVINKSVSSDYYLYTMQGVFATTKKASVRDLKALRLILHDPDRFFLASSNCSVLMDFHCFPTWGWTSQNTFALRKTQNVCLRVFAKTRLNHVNKANVGSSLRTKRLYALNQGLNVVWVHVLIQLIQCICNVVLVASCWKLVVRKYVSLLWLTLHKRLHWCGANLINTHYVVNTRECILTWFLGHPSLLRVVRRK